MQGFIVFGLFGAIRFLLSQKCLLTAKSKQLKNKRCFFGTIYCTTRVTDNHLQHEKKSQTHYFMFFFCWLLSSKDPNSTRLACVVQLGALEEEIEQLGQMRMSTVALISSVSTVAKPPPQPRLTQEELITAQSKINILIRRHSDSQPRLHSYQQVAIASALMRRKKVGLMHGHTAHAHWATPPLRQRKVVTPRSRHG